MKILDSFDLRVLEAAPPPAVRQPAGGMVSMDALPKFELVNAESIAEAIFLLKTYEGRVALIAGGQDLLLQLRGRVRPTQPRVLVNVKSIRPKLDYIRESAAGLAVGSLATLHDIETNQLIKEKYSLLARAAYATRVRQYRNVATLGGDLCQQVRCWYYRASGNAFFCQRKGGEECHALEGDNRHHGIFGSRVCPATCPSDTAPALVALGASVKMVGDGGERTVPVGEFFTPLGNVLEPDEVVTEVQIPHLEPGSRGVFLKFTPGNIFDRAIVSVAVAAELPDGLCRKVSIVLGAVSPAPWRAVQAEQVLTGESINEAVAARAAQAAVEGAAPLSMNAHKVDIAKALVKRAILGMASPA